MIVIITALVLWNVITFIVMGLDKSFARHDKRRISEKTLLTLSFLLGGVGIGLGALIFHHKTKKSKFRIGIPLSLLVNAALFVMILNTYVVLYAYPSMVYTYRGEELTNDSIAELSSYEPECAMILGCAVYADGSPCPMLRDRLDTGIELYKSGVVDRLLLTGDNGQEQYNEIHTMFNYCLDAGIPREALYCDHAGFSTYDSAYRADSIFYIKRMIIVTQKYHEFRALYIARKKGIEAIGVSSDQQRYTGAFYREAREVLARDKDYVKVLIKALPLVGGDEIPITGDAELTHDE